MTTSSSTITRFCETCGSDRDHQRVERKESAKIRGVDVTADVPYLVCPVCGHAEPDFFDDRDPMLPLYQAYREKRGLLDPAGIRKVREVSGLSHEAFAAVLGVSPTTLYRYEAGALQDDAHDALLRLCSHQDAFDDLVRWRRDRISELQLGRYREAHITRKRLRGSRAPKEENTEVVDPVNRPVSTRVNRPPYKRDDQHKK